MIGTVCESLPENESSADSSSLRVFLVMILQRRGAPVDTKFDVLFCSG